MERKILYKNVFIPNEEDIREYVAQQHLPERSGLITLGCLLVVSLVIALWIFLGTVITLVDSTIFHLFFGICLIVSVTIVNRVLKMIQLNALVNKYVKQNKSDIEGFSSLFYEDGFEVNGKSYEYLDVKNVLYGRTCLFLIIKNGADIMIKDDESAFESGEHAQFWEFLNSKVTIEKEKKKQNPLSLFRH